VVEEENNPLEEEGDKNPAEKEDDENPAWEGDKSAEKEDMNLAGQV
jgi:hypothetical protein